MKKTMRILICLIVLLALVGCAKNAEDPPAGQSGNETPAPVLSEAPGESPDAGVPEAVRSDSEERDPAAAEPQAGSDAPDSFLLKSGVNEEDVLLYRERLAYTASGGDPWQGGYQVEATFPAEENDVIHVFCDAANVYGNIPITIVSQDENGNAIFTYAVSRHMLMTAKKAAVQLDAGTASITVRVALISANFGDNVPGSGDVAFIDHLVLYKNGASIKPSGDDEADRLTDYTLPAEWSGRIPEILSAKAGKFTFAVQTDTHFGAIGTGIYAASYDDLMNNLSKLTEYVDFDFICNLGDIMRGYDYDSTEDMLEACDEVMRRYVANLHCPLLVIPGNHDTNRMYAEAQGDVGLQITKETLYSKIIPPVKKSAPNAVFNGRSLYYYLDFEDAGIRTIFLNSTDGNYSGSEFGDTFVISNEQLKWFETVALDTDKAIMVFCHCPLADGMHKNTVKNHVGIMDAIHAFKNAGGTVIGCFYGHTHKQESMVDGENVLHVTFTCGGTCAEVVMVDMENRTISTIGIGKDTKGKPAVDRAFTF